jgi:hypothetical protein
VNPDGAVIRPVALGDVAAFRDCSGKVMRERPWHAFVDDTRVRGKKMDGEYDDVHMMAIHLAGMQ